MSPHKATLMAKLARLGLGAGHLGYYEPLPLVTLEDFFEGNEDPESIAINLLSANPSLNAHPGLDYFYGVLKQIRALPEVQDVLVEILEIETALTYDDAWPYAERVYFFTCAPEVEVERWSVLLKTDGPIPDDPHRPKATAPTLREGYAAWSVVWD